MFSVGQKIRVKKTGCYGTISFKTGNYYFVMSDMGVEKLYIEGELEAVSNVSVSEDAKNQ